MAVFTAISAFATYALGPGALSVLGLSPAVTAAVFSVGRSVLWSLAAAKLAASDLPRQKIQATLTETNSPRLRAYGRNLLGGQKVFFEAKDGALYQIVVAAHGRADGLIQFWIDGEPVSRDASTGEIEEHKFAWFRNGSGAGGDYAEVLTKFPEIWDSRHRLEGQVTFCTKWGDPSDEDFAKVFPKGPNTQAQVEFRGLRVKDNSGAVAYSENAGLIVRDFLTSPEGWRISESLIDADSFANFADLCGQSVATATGSEPRYSLCGYYSLDEQLKEVTGRMLATCDGQVYETPEGKVGILGGKWSTPDFTLTADDILSVEMQEGFDPFTVYNVLRGSFVSPDHGYQPTEVAERRDEVALATQEERAEQHDVEMCPSDTQLQRLMKIKEAKDKRAWTGTVRTNLVGLKARFPKGDGIHTIRIVAEEFGIDEVFEVTSHSFSVPDGMCEIGIASLENPYGWSVSEEKSLPPTFNEIARPNNVVTDPVNPIVVQHIVKVSGDTQGVKFVVSVDDPGRNDLTLQAQIAEGTHAATAGANWVAMGGTRLRAESSVLDDGTTYTVRIRWRGKTDWIVAATQKAVANPTQPAAPTSFSAVATGGSVALDWINAPANFYRTQIYRNTVNNFSTATLIKTVAGVSGEVSGYVDTPPSGNHRYWAVTINGSGVQSTPAGPATVTV